MGCYVVRCDVTAPSAGWGLAPCEVWLLEEERACSCHFLGVPNKKASLGRVCVGTMLTCPRANSSRLGGLTPNPVFFHRDAVQTCILIVDILVEEGRVNLERATCP